VFFHGPKADRSRPQSIPVNAPAFANHFDGLSAMLTLARNGVLGDHSPEAPVTSVGSAAMRFGKRIRAEGILARGELLATATKQRRRSARTTQRKNGPKPRTGVEFAAGSLEAELSAIGKAAPAREWANVPVDYFANLDHYLHGAPKKK
jgi:hypothetical protein